MPRSLRGPVFAERGERFEWKLHGHDRPTDLSQRLRAAGFVPEETETIVIAPVAEIAGEVRLPDGVSLREVTSRADLLRVAGLEQAVWGEHGQEDWLVKMLESERAVDPSALTIVVAEAGPTVVCAAWIRFEGDTRSSCSGFSSAPGQRRVRSLMTDALWLQPASRWVSVSATQRRGQLIRAGS